VAAVLAAHPDIKIEPIPGPSALTAALSICGFNTQEFVFLGWPPHKKGRETWFKNLVGESRVTVFYESVYRVKNALERLAAICPERNLMLGRELTKKFESVYRGAPTEVLKILKNSPDNLRGEFVIVI
jgi:16S rRNA (cytidine1402-2'-O)-methyltransferase